MKKKREHWTTKNNHLKAFRKRDENSERPMSRFDKICDKIGTWLIVIAAVIFIILKALDNHIVGYDYFPNIPIEWIEWLK